MTDCGRSTDVYFNKILCSSLIFQTLLCLENTASTAQGRMEKKTMSENIILTVYFLIIAYQLIPIGQREKTKVTIRRENLRKTARKQT